MDQAPPFRRQPGLRDAPAARRNGAPILDVLRRTLPRRGTVLEIASGTGQHAAMFAPALAPLAWLPSDPDPGQRTSIAAWSAGVRGTRPLPPRAIDAAQAEWDVSPSDCIVAIVAINLLHIAPWPATLGLLAGAASILPGEGQLCLYGPFMRAGRHTGTGNARFDAQLRSQNPAWGVRDLDVVAGRAQELGLFLDQVNEMPSNNLLAVFRNRPATGTMVSATGFEPVTR